ncbi:MAG: hypothetical protein WD361_05380, partial [Gracilimonas sp.]
HPNPQVATSNIPDYLRAYTGVEIPPRVNHVHIYVEGENLDWAMPLEDFSKLNDKQREGISIAKLEINGHNEKNQAVKNFAETIHLQANFSFTSGMIFN